MNLNTLTQRYHRLSQIQRGGVVLGSAAVLIVIAIIGIRSGGSVANTIEVTRGSIAQVV